MRKRLFLAASRFWASRLFICNNIKIQHIRWNKTDRSINSYLIRMSGRGSFLIKDERSSMGSILWLEKNKFKKWKLLDFKKQERLSLRDRRTMKQKGTKLLSSFWLFGIIMWLGVLIFPLPILLLNVSPHIPNWWRGSYILTLLGGTKCVDVEFMLFSTAN